MQPTNLAVVYPLGHSIIRDGVLRMRSYDGDPFGAAYHDYQFVYTTVRSREVDDFHFSFIPFVRKEEPGSEFDKVNDIASHVRRFYHGQGQFEAFVSEKGSVIYVMQTGPNMSALCQWSKCHDLELALDIISNADIAAFAQNNLGIFPIAAFVHGEMLLAMGENLIISPGNCSRQIINYEN